jgi:hypothetical protein
MDNLPSWALQIIAVAVGLSPGLALLSALSIDIQRLFVEPRIAAIERQTLMSEHNIANLKS